MSVQRGDMGIRKCIRKLYMYIMYLDIYVYMDIDRCVDAKYHSRILPFAAVDQACDFRLSRLQQSIGRKASFVVQKAAAVSFVIHRRHSIQYIFANSPPTTCSTSHNIISFQS
jgi:hypothetical protein